MNWHDQLRKEAFRIAFPGESVPDSREISLTVEYSPGWGEPNDNSDTFDPEYMTLSISSGNNWRSFDHQELAGLLRQLFTARGEQ